MSDELLPPTAGAMDSPKLRWLKQHGLVTLQPEHGGTECPETGEEIPIWVCRTPEPSFGWCWRPCDIGGGDTEQEACAHVAIQRGIKLWNEIP